MLTWIPIFILFGPLWFVLFFIASCLIIAAIDNDRGGLATLTIVTTIVLMTVFGTLPLLDWITNHGWTFLGIIAGYFLIGGPIGGIARWITFVHDELEKYENFKISWLQSKNIGGNTLPDNYKIEFLIDAAKRFSWVKIKGNKTYDQRPGNYAGYDLNTIRVTQSHPLAWQNKSKIVTWMTYWPWTLIWLVLDDIVTRWFKIIQRKLSNFMDQIARKIFNRYNNDFELPTPPTTPENPA